MVDIYTAKASDFDRAAQRCANSFWFWLVVAVVVWLAASIWWALIPAALASWNVYQSIGATQAATALRRGTYRFPNPNNGKPEASEMEQTSD